MRNEDRLYDYVYRDMITKIHTRVFDYGEEILTLMEICEVYQVSRNTARTAVKLLEENGYVKTIPRKPPVVCFDLANPEYRPKYLKEFAQRRETILEIFDAFATLMPDIAANILASATVEERAEIAQQLTGCIGDISKVTEQELSDNLFRTYEKTIKLSGNNLLSQLFAAWYHLIIIPMPRGKQRSLPFKAMLPVTKHILKRLGRMAANEQYDDLKKQISAFSKMIGKKTVTFFEEDCKDIIVEEREEFHWFAGASQEINYLTLATVIISDIRTGKYQPGDILPSYAQLAQSMNTSEKTSRKAVEVLNKLRLVCTINGVGTKVMLFKVNNVIEALKDDVIRANMGTFFEAMHIIALTCRSVAKDTLEKMEVTEIKALKEEMTIRRNISVSRLVEKAYGHNKSTVVRNMYSRIKPTLILGYFFEFLWSDHIDQQEGLAEEFILLIDQKKYSEVAEKLFLATAEAYTLAKNFAQEQGLNVNLRPENFGA